MCREVRSMLRREIPTPIFLGIIVLMLIFVFVIFGRQLIRGRTEITLEQLPPEIRKRMAPFPPAGQQAPTKP